MEMGDSLFQTVGSDDTHVEFVTQTGSSGGAGGNTSQVIVTVSKL
ncbi:MAG: hypothetical protein ACYC5A_09030 [Thermoleophilia bacterium]